MYFPLTKDWERVWRVVRTRKCIWNEAKSMLIWLGKTNIDHIGVGRKAIGFRQQMGIVLKFLNFIE